MTLAYTRWPSRCKSMETKLQYFAYFCLSVISRQIKITYHGWIHAPEIELIRPSRSSVSTFFPKPPVILTKIESLMTQCLSFSTKSISLIENCQGRLAERCSKFWKTISWSKVQDTNAYKPETPVTKGYHDVN